MGPWLATIARRAAIDVHRREARRSHGSLDATVRSEKNDGEIRGGGCLMMRRLTLVLLVTWLFPAVQAPPAYAEETGWLSAIRGMPCQTTTPVRLTTRARSGPGSPGGASCLIRWKTCGSRSAASGRLSPAARRS